MNEDSLNDPILQSLEARLGASAPRLSVDEQHELFYACAFAAGQKMAVRSTRRWQAATAALGMTIIGLTIPQITGPTNVFRTVPVQNESQRAANSHTDTMASATDSTVESYESRSTVERSPNVRLDAWQRTRSTAQFGSAKLAQHNSSETGRDGLTAGGLNLGALD